MTVSKDPGESKETRQILFFYSELSYFTSRKSVIKKNNKFETFQSIIKEAL